MLWLPYSRSTIESPFSAEEATKRLGSLVDVDESRSLLFMAKGSDKPFCGRVTKTGFLVVPSSREPLRPNLAFIDIAVNRREAQSAIQVRVLDVGLLIPFVGALGMVFVPAGKDVDLKWGFLLFWCAGRLFASYVGQWTLLDSLRRIVAPRFYE